MVDRLNTMDLRRLRLWAKPVLRPSLPERDEYEHSQNLARSRTARYAKTGGQQKMNGGMFGYVRVLVASDVDANNGEPQLHN